MNGRCYGHSVAVQVESRADYSSDFELAAQAEADRLKVEVERLRSDAAKNLETADKLAALALELETRARALDEMLGRSPQLTLTTASHVLGGEQLRLVAVAVLAEARGPGFPIHYKEWYELLRAAGHEVQGQDPLATFLAQVTRSPAVVSASPNRGVYVLDLDRATERVASKLRTAEVALVRAQAAMNAGRAREVPSGQLRDLTEAVRVARRAHRAAQREATEVARTQMIVAGVRRESAEVA